jgi:hypothetical protein
MEEVSRRALRHLLLRRRNERIAADPRAAVAVRLLRMHPDTWDDLRLDPDPLEADTVDFEGRTFCGVPVVGDLSLAAGVIEVDWPAAVEVSDAG